MKRVAFCPSAAANIISAGDAHDQGFRRTEVPHEDAFDLYHPEGGPIMRFGRIDLGHGRRSKMYLKVVLVGNVCSVLTCKKSGSELNCCNDVYCRRFTNNMFCLDHMEHGVYRSSDRFTACSTT
jgi:hypothetical protein